MTLLFGCDSKQPLAQENLFVLHAQEGTFERNTVDFQLAKLEMKRVSSEVTYFGPAPKREAGSLPLASFLARWNKEQNRLRQAPESAGFLFFDKDGKQYDHLAVKLLLPSYNSGSDTLTVVLESIDGKFSFVKEEIKEVTLFLNLKL